MPEFNCPHCGKGVVLTVGVGPGGGSSPFSPSEALDLPRLITIYATEQTQSQTWSPQWAALAEPQLRKFAATGLPLSRSGVSEWKSDLLAKGKATKTVNIHLATLGAFCRWLESRGEIQSNPCARQSIRGNHLGADEQRLAFTPEEVGAILKATKALAPNDAGLQGLVWSMAYTGARNEEIAQLKKVDLQWAKPGLPVFDLSTLGENQRRKNRSSRRVIPISSALWAHLESTLTFAPGNTGLDGNLWGFPVDPKGNYSYRPSRWANEVVLDKLKKENLVRNDDRLTLYSLRHSVTTLLKHQGVQDSLISELVGHANASMTTGRYGKKYPIEALKEVVELIVWPQ